MAPSEGAHALTTHKDLAALLRASADEVVAQWSRDLKATSFAGYADCPIDELESDCRQCLEGYIATIGEGNYSRIRRFIKSEVRVRVSQGFRASEIARKFCVFESAALPLVSERFGGNAVALASALSRMHSCVTNALIEFSDMYEAASQARVEEYMAEMEAMNRRLEQISVRDPLTGLHNRRYLQDRLSNEFQRALRHQRPLALLMVDIDHFKSINDTYGHQVGDQVLRSVALLIVNQTRSTDVAARYGGEEFVAVLPETDGDGAVRVAEKLRESVALSPLHRMESDPGDAFPIHGTVSIGVAVIRPEMNDASQLISEADTALYSAKGSGRNRAVAAWQLVAPTLVAGA